MVKLIIIVKKDFVHLSLSVQNDISLYCLHSKIISY